MGNFKDARRHLLVLVAVEFSGLIVQNLFGLEYKVPLAEDSLNIESKLTG